MVLQLIPTAVTLFERSAEHSLHEGLTARIHHLDSRLPSDHTSNTLTLQEEGLRLRRHQQEDPKHKDRRYQARLHHYSQQLDQLAESAGHGTEQGLLHLKTDHAVAYIIQRGFYRTERPLKVPQRRARSPRRPEAGRGLNQTIQPTHPGFQQHPDPTHS